MSSESDREATTILDLDSAFAALGHEIRTEIVKILGDSDGPLSFSEIYEQVEMRDSSQFNYHLDKLVGHFVVKSGDGYELRPAGERVVEAILSGAVTEDPVVTRTDTSESCPYCGAPVEIRYYEERVISYCTECEGSYGDSGGSDDTDITTASDATADNNVTADNDDTDDGAESSGSVRSEPGYLGYQPLPPAGVRNRTAAEISRAAHAWNMSERLPAATGVCPRCSARLDESIRLCERHESGDSDGLCGECGHRHAVQHAADCTNCIFDQRGAFVLALLAETELLSFLTDHGINPVTPSEQSAHRVTEVVMDYEETILDTDPFRGRFTFEIDGETLALTVDDELAVVQAVRS